jgi:hypothetical protein
MLWEDQTKTIARRISEIDEKGLVAEVDFDGECIGTGRMAGMVARFAGTDKYQWKPGVDAAITGTAQGQMTFRSGEIVLFKAVGIGNQVSFPSATQLNVLSLLNFIDPPQSFSWLRSTLVLWEARVDLQNRTATGWAYEWTPPK